MKAWLQRPIEIRNLFNPAFCGLILFRSLNAYQVGDNRGMPFSLSLLVLPLCLHRQSRELFRNGARSYFLKIASSHPELQVGFAKRCADVLPFTFEALGLLMHMGTLSVSSDGRLSVSPDGVRKTVSGTSESIDCQRVAIFLGKEFARVCDRVTVYTSLGVKP